MEIEGEWKGKERHLNVELWLCRPVRAASLPGLRTEHTNIPVTRIQWQKDTTRALWSYILPLRLPEYGSGSLFFPEWKKEIRRETWGHAAIAATT